MLGRQKRVLCKFDNKVLLDVPAAPSHFARCRKSSALEHIIKLRNNLLERLASTGSGGYLPRQRVKLVNVHV